MTASPDGKRLASGGLDGHVRIWSTETIKKFKDYKSNTNGNTATNIDIPNCRPLCSMARHTGAVTAVKFSPSGRFLATGSDDRVVLIWEKDDNYVPTIGLGQTQTDLEHWTVRRRLVAHDNDVQDIAWAPDSSILVTVGLDRSIIIWSGVTFEKIKRFDIHNSHVKGVVFDPATKYFATASDDRSVLIFRYHKTTASNDISFFIELKVTKPFKGSPLTTYFRRLSWSPDGQHIAVPNAVNGPVSSVAIINRGDWNSDISLIGHSSPCEVAAFSPRLYEAIEDDDSSSKIKKKKKLSTVVATAGQDRVLAIWKTNCSRPLLVANDICFKTISDLAWSPDGSALYLSSSDGTITVMFFERNELGKTIPLEENNSYLYRYGGDTDAKVYAESTEQLMLEECAKNVMPVSLESRMTQIIKTSNKDRNSDEKTKALTTSKVSKPAVLKPVKKLNQQVKLTKDGKKRIAPTLLTTVSTNKKEMSTKKLNIGVFNEEMKKSKETLLSAPFYRIPPLGVKTFVSGVKTKVLDEEKEKEDMLDNIFDSVSTLHSDAKAHPSNVKESNFRKTSIIKKIAKDIDYPEYLKKVVQCSIQSVQYNNYNSYNVHNRSTLIVVCDNGGSKIKEKASLHIQNSFQYDKNDKFDNDVTPTRLVSVDGKGEKSFELFLQESIINCICNCQLKLWILLNDKGGIYFISFTGKFAFPKIELNQNVCVLKSTGDYLMAITNTGLVNVWDIKKFKKVATGISLSPIIYDAKIEIKEVLELSNKAEPFDKGQDSTNVNVITDSKELTPDVIESCEVSKEGIPVIILGSGESYGWSPELFCWVEISEIRLGNISHIDI